MSACFFNVNKDLTDINHCRVLWHWSPSEQGHTSEVKWRKWWSSQPQLTYTFRTFLIMSFMLMPHYSVSLLALHESLHCFPPLYRQLDRGGVGAHRTWVQQVHASCDVQCQHMRNRCAFWYFPCPLHKCAVNLCHLSGKWRRNLSDNHQFMNDGQKKTGGRQGKKPGSLAAFWDSHAIMSLFSNKRFPLLISIFDAICILSLFFILHLFLFPANLHGLVYFTTLQLVERHFDKSLAI